ncbi:MAG: 23S rRNA (uracil(1939)-C(5))-methyltransferase RlmD [Clostridiales bacterium]|nr:23S rRNA (uracil(1939)-C(5))-methyltransferase RlmD [Clostridiales bacterium]
MNVKDIIEVEIEDNGMDGEGVARAEGKVVFIPYTLKGEKVRATVKSVKARYCNASAIKILSPSPFRAQPECPHYFRCGGCDTMHITENYRREILVNDLKNNLKKIAGLNGVSCEFVPCEEKNGVRNKVAMPFGTVDGKTAIGLYRHGTHELERVECKMLGPIGKSAAKTVVDFANEKKLPPYEEKSGKGLLRHLVIREIGCRASVTLVVNGEGIGALPERELSARLGDKIDFFISQNAARNNVILGKTARLVSGNPTLPVDVLGVKAELSPLSFFQVNDKVRDMLYSAALKNVTSPTLIDLYSGIGVTSNLAAKKCAKVYAVECVPEAVKDADRTAELNGNKDKIENICGDAEKILPALKDKVSSEVDILVDPPRKGCGDAVMRALADIKPNTLIYISCNHATMCRDIAPLISGEYGAEYTIESVKLFDMFPQTHHSETLVVLKSK